LPVGREKKGERRPESWRAGGFTGERRREVGAKALPMRQSLGNLFLRGLSENPLSYHEDSGKASNALTIYAKKPRRGEKRCER